MTAFCENTYVISMQAKTSCVGKSVASFHCVVGCLSEVVTHYLTTVGFWLHKCGEQSPAVRTDPQDYKNVKSFECSA